MNDIGGMAHSCFTTNFFRCYDLPLAVGLNTMVLQAVDWNGNVASNTVSYTVDFNSDTSAPVLTPQWPTNGVAVSGDNFTMSGTINNPSAGIVVTVASSDGTNTFYGIASTDGQYWVPDVTLGAGTNTMTIISTSPGGQSTTNTMTVVKSTLEVTIDTGISVTAAFNLDVAGDVTGTINGTAGYSVSCNGVAATTDVINGVTYWRAEDVPGNENGWMELVATVTPSGGGTPITTRYEWEKPPLLRLKEYHLNSGFLGTWPTNQFTLHSDVLDYTRKQGGTHTQQLWTDGGCTASWKWTVDDVFTGYLKTCTNGSGSSDTNTYGFTESPPNTLSELSDVAMSQANGDEFWTFHHRMEQQMDLRAGGYPGRLDLMKFHANAGTNNYGVTQEGPQGVPVEGVAGGAIPNEFITVLGEAVDNDGNRYAAVPSGRIQQVPIAVPGASKTVALTVTNQKVLITFRGSGTLTHRETNGPGGKVYGYQAGLYDQVITNHTGTNRLGADNPPYKGRWFNFEECDANVPTNTIFDTGWQWQRDVQDNTFTWDPTIPNTLAGDAGAMTFTSIPPGSGTGNDTTGGAYDNVPDGNRLILGPDAPGPFVLTNVPTGTIMAHRFYAREWLTYSGALASDVLRWRSFVTIRLGTNGIWSRVGTNLIGQTPVNDPEQPKFTVPELMQILSQ